MRTAFYTYKLPEKLELREGALELLESIKNQFRLFLVTAGPQKKQLGKVEKAQIKHFFEDCFFIDGLSFKTKGQAFEKVLNQCKINANETMSIGNRIDQEIAEAKKLGCNTCLIRYGEHRFMIAENEYEKADWEFQNLEELKSILKLEGSWNR